MRSVLRVIAIVLISVIVVPLGSAATVLAALLFIPLPAVLPEPKPGIASQVSHIYDINGNEIGTFHRFETSIPFSKDELPTVLKEAVVAAEDRNFYKHGGVDVRGTVRAFWNDFRNKKVVEGGSTITQQYVKNAYTGGARTVWRKLKEAILATRIDQQVSKDDILYRYLSLIYLGNGAYGVEAASELYFRKPVSHLTLSEAALLAGIIPAPSVYEPLGSPANAEARRRRVLEKMYDQHYITFDQWAQALSQGVWIASSGPPPGPATLIYKPETTQNKYPYFIDYVERYLQPRYGDRLYTGGLRIQTTLDPRLQDLAEKTVADQLAGTSPPLDMSLVAVEPPTGYVKALVGGRDFYHGSQVNLALGGCPVRPSDPEIVAEVTATCWDPGTQTVSGGGLGRQPGSAFKPFVLATAFSEGIAPSKVYPAPNVFHIPNCVGPTCSIGNNEGEGGGSTDIRHAAWYSINTVFAQLIRDVGCTQTAQMAKKLGITSAWYSPQFHTCSGTYALGVIDVSPLDMASAYGVFANGGKRAEPTPVLRVVDAQNHVLEDHLHPNTPQVIDQVVADNVTDVLKGVISYGTGTGADIGRPAAGKTGTTEGFTNAWFVGYTPTLSTSVWMGYTDNQSTPLVNIGGVSAVYGGTIPASTWHAFMSEALRGVPPSDFNQPAPIRPLSPAALPQLRTTPTTAPGITAGTQRYPSDTPADCGGPCVMPLLHPGLTPAPYSSVASNGPSP